MFNFFKTVIREALYVVVHIERLSCHSIDKMIEFFLWSRSQLPEESLTTTVLDEKSTVLSIYFVNVLPCKRASCRSSKLNSHKFIFIVYERWFPVEKMLNFLMITVKP